MKKTLILSTALALAATGCKMLEPRPSSSTGEQCSALGGPAPELPPLQVLPDTAALPPLPDSPFIVVSACEPTQTFVAMGVDPQARRFTFLIKGTAATRAAAFARFYEAGVPVTVYTGPVKLNAGAQPPAPTSEPLPSEPSPTPGEGTEPEEPPFEPCLPIAEVSIGDDPTDPRGPTGYPPYDPIWGFQKLAWHTANALDAVTDLAPATTAPAPQ